MFYIGIDIAKRKHEAVITDDKGTVIQRPFSFPNSHAGFNILMEKVRKITLYRPELSFGMESTSHYWLPLYARLMKEGYRVHVINPIQSDALRGLFIRQTKTDANDSLIIAEVIRFGRFSETKVPQDKQHALREMCRNRFYMVDSVSDLKRKTIALIDQVFPEFETMFSNVFLVSTTELLAKYPTPDKILSARTDTLTGLLLKHSNGHFGKAKALELKAAAKATFGVPDSCGVYADLIRTYVEQIKFIQGQVEALDNKIKLIMDSFDTPILSVSGIGPVFGAVIISEIGDIKRFGSADKLAAFAGMDPTMKQSGAFTGDKNHMSKRGTPYLRRAVWLASVVAVQIDPMFKAYFEKKRAEGKSYMTAIGHVTKKMISVIFAVLRDNKAYEPVLNIA